MNKRKNIRLLKGFVNLNNYNSIGNLHYKIKKPIEIRNGNWGCRIAFFIDDKLLYYNKNTYANQRPPYESFNIVNFSRDGTMALFEEIILGELNNLVLIDVENMLCFKKALSSNIEINQYVIRNKIISDKAEILRSYFLDELKFNQVEFIRNRISLNNIFSKWYG